MRPLQRFADTEAAGGVVMLAMAIAALVWANSPFGDSYVELWETPISLHIGELIHLDLDLRGWVNDLAMAFFFFVGRTRDQARVGPRRTARSPCRCASCARSRRRHDRAGSDLHPLQRRRRWRRRLGNPDGDRHRIRRRRAVAARAPHPVVTRGVPPDAGHRRRPRRNRRDRRVLHLGAVVRMARRRYRVCPRRSRARTAPTCAPRFRTSCSRCSVGWHSTSPAFTPHSPPSPSDWSRRATRSCGPRISAREHVTSSHGSKSPRPRKPARTATTKRRWRPTPSTN